MDKGHGVQRLRGNVDLMKIMQGTRYNQFGNSVLSTQIQFLTLEKIVGIDHEVKLQLDCRREKEIREAILTHLIRNQSFYFPPFIFSSRSSIYEVKGGFELNKGSKIYLIDGLHRMMGLSSTLKYLKMQKKLAEEASNYEMVIEQQRFIDIISMYPIAMQIYLDLDHQGETQLYFDYNTERKEAHKGLVMQYDQRDKYVELAREVARKLEDELDIEVLSSRLTIQNSAITSIKTMRKCLIAMFEGRLTEKTGDPYFRNCKLTDVPVISSHFFASWTRLFPRNMSNREIYVSGLTGIQVALAYAVHLLTKIYSVTHIEAIAMLELLNKQQTWKHCDVIFAHMYCNSRKQLKSHSTTTAIKKTALVFLLAIEKERSVPIDCQ